MTHSPSPPRRGEGFVSVFLLTFTVALAYTGRAWLGAVPVSAVALRVALVRSPLRLLRRLRPLLLLLGLLGASALLSALVHPSATAAPFLETLAACGALAVLTALGPQAQLLRFWLLLATAVAVVLVLLTALSDPALFADKMPAGAAPLVRRLGAGPGPGRGVLHANGVGVLIAVMAAGWSAEAAVRRTWRARLRPLGPALAAAGLLAGTGSRGGLVALAGSLLAVLAGRWRPWLLPVAGAAAAALLVAVALAAAALPAEPPALRAVPGAAGGLHDLRWRALVWRGAVAGGARSPWVGTGIGSFPAAYVPGPGVERPVNSHDTLLQVWLDTGAGGVAAVAGLTGLALAGAARRAAVRPAALVVGAVTVAWVLHSVVESTVAVTVASEQPWLGTVEVVVPLGFALFGLAFAADSRPASAA